MGLLSIFKGFSDGQCCESGDESNKPIRPILISNYLLPIMSFAAGSSGCSSVISETPLMLASNALQASDDDIISRISRKKRGKRGSLSKSQSVTKERKQQDLVILCDKKPQQYITSKVSRYNQSANRISGSV